MYKRQGNGHLAPFVSGSLLSGLNLVVAVLCDSVDYVCVIAALRGRLLSVKYISHVRLSGLSQSY